MKDKGLKIGALTFCLFALTMLGCSHPTVHAQGSWNPKAAATYLDSREAWWSGWQQSARDHGTFCVSCHTALPYALARPALRAVLGEPVPALDERQLIDNVTKRVALWNDEEPYYNDQSYEGKTSESRATEAVLNALILAGYDARSGRLRDDTRKAFENMWQLQQRQGSQSGSWLWLQFDEEPWEAADSAYYGATLAALSVGTAPENYALTPEIQDHLKLLREYLIRESPSQSTINHIFLLWASSKLPGLLGQEQKDAIVKEIFSRQQQDGGWRLATITWSWRRWSVRSLVQMWLREDGTPLEGKSDGLATGLVTFVLQEAGVPRENNRLRNGLAWLIDNQNVVEGSWPASSVNKKRVPTSNVGRFMSDAATAYAVLSLTDAQRGEFPVAMSDKHDLR